MLAVSLISTLLILTLFGAETLQQVRSESALATLNWRVVLIEQALPLLWCIGFWFAWQATPGKLLLNCRIVDANSLGRPRAEQLVLRYLGYIVGALVFGLGLLWVLWDKRKQGWHDKLARTVVIMQDDSLLTLDELAMDAR